MLTDVHLTQELQDELTSLFRAYSDIRSAKNGILTSTPNGVLVHTSFQTIFRLTHPTKFREALHQHVMTHAVKAETIVPGGFDSCLRILLQRKSDIAPYNNVQSILRYPVPNMNDISDLVVRYTSTHIPKHIRGMIIDAIDLAGFNGKIVIEKTGNSPSVEHVSGYSFALKPAVNVSTSSTLSEPRVVCIDGFIENVAEAHSLFEQIAASEQVTLLFVRGMSDEVKHTIKVNFDRGKMKIIPYVVRFDFDGVNTLVDIATIAGNDVVSSHRGDLISAVKLADHRSIERADVTQKGFILYNKGTKLAVSRHVAKLTEKRADVNEHLADMLEQRIRTLVSNTVFVRLTDDMNFVTSSQAVDYAVRAVRSAMSYGITRDDIGPMPSIVPIVSEKFAVDCMNSLSQLGAAVTLADRDQQAL